MTDKCYIWYMVKKSFGCKYGWSLRPIHTNFVRLRDCGLLHTTISIFVHEYDKMRFFFKSFKWYGMVWYGMVWYGMVWYGMIWYDIWYMIYDIWYMAMASPIRNIWSIYVCYLLLITSIIYADHIGDFSCLQQKGYHSDWTKPAVVTLQYPPDQCFWSGT